MIIPVEIRPPQPQEQAAMYYQRWLVLRHPLGKPMGSEQDDFDQTQGTHYRVALKENTIVGSARLRLFDSGEGSIAYVAVLPDFARQGIGRQLIHHLLKIAQQQQLATVGLKARVSAQTFYEKLGFQATSALFNYLDIPHVEMQIALSATPGELRNELL